MIHFRKDSVQHCNILEGFIVFEGIDGSGTTTQLNRIMRDFASRNIKAFATREPTSSSLGMLIDSFLKKQVFFSPQTVTRLFATDRCEHIYGKGGILEMLQKGIVISDRYLFSSLAYQGATDQGMLALSENAAFPLPQMLFFFELPVEVAMKRIEMRCEEQEFYERCDFLIQVQQNYCAIMEEYQTKYPDMKIIRIDASQSEDAVFDKIKSHLKLHFI